MMDPLAAGVAGVVTSIGPCVAPRYIAIAALLGRRRRMLTIVTFVAGMLASYTALAFGAGILAAVTGHAWVLYGALAVALATCGLVTLLRNPACEHAVSPHAAAAPPARLSAVFCVGAGSAFVVSPCCTPIVAAVVGMSAGDADAFTRVTLLSAFTLGHAAPLFAAGLFGTVCGPMLRTWNAGPAPAVVSGALMLALGAYYGLLL